MKRQLTCIGCPRGCALEVELGESGEVLSVSGNICPRGKVYATDECTNPRRVVTTTVRCADGIVVPVKTEGSIPKSLVFEAMKQINKVRPEGDLKIGDVVIENVAGTGVRVLVTGKKA